MQFVKSSNVRRKRKSARLTGERRLGQYVHNLQFYSVPPSDNISLTEFEDFAIDRLKVLKHVESLGIKFVKGNEKYQESMDRELRKMMPIAIRKTSDEISDTDYDERRKDHISHFILRLAYCRSEELRRWFIAQELDLFRYRFQQESRDSIKQFLEENNLHYEPIPDKEKLKIIKELANSGYNTSVTTVENTDYFKVPFVEALDLVKSRKVYLERGYAYVPRSDLVSIVLSAFRAHLSHSLAITARAVPYLEEDSRLLPMLTALSKQYLGQDYTCKKANGKVTIDQIEPLSKKSFPLCMRQLQESLKQEHHLRHWGRMQYGLFLKGIGVMLEDALRFWRAEFSKKIDPDKFDKSYSYNIRHNYGKEGKRADYTPYSCMKIIMTNPPANGDFHGCPFRHSDAGLLRQRLASYGVSKDGVNEVMGLVSNSHYQLACAKYFDLTHNVEASTIGINHPNQYFDESQKILNPSAESKASMSSSQSSQMSWSHKSTPFSRRSTQASQLTPRNIKEEEVEFDDLQMSYEELDDMMSAVEKDEKATKA
ncbi:DNA primase large subunit-like [Saccoglossus kowalevskii]|uniref:DNA primase large subunit n=1 Tax=Saccoglossus kowalevskii TaxID=10224 RepID=A0ABM0GY77_SACKO|nr:PREDICTED: DNA primase large subunit-like [Saccoglossus kowalevskii]